MKESKVSFVFTRLVFLQSITVIKVKYHSIFIERSWLSYGLIQTFPILHRGTHITCLYMAIVISGPIFTICHFFYNHFLPGQGFNHPKSENKYRIGPNTGSELLIHCNIYFYTDKFSVILV